MLIEQLLSERERYDNLMGEMLNNPPSNNITEEQKQKDILHYKFYEKRWGEINEQIRKELAEGDEEGEDEDIDNCY